MLIGFKTEGINLPSFIMDPRGAILTFHSLSILAELILAPAKRLPLSLRPPLLLCFFDQQQALVNLTRGSFREMNFQRIFSSHLII